MRRRAVRRLWRPHLLRPRRRRMDHPGAKCCNSNRVRCRYHRRRLLSLRRIKHSRASATSALPLRRIKANQDPRRSLASPRRSRQRSGRSPSSSRCAPPAASSVPRSRESADEYTHTPRGSPCGQWFALGDLRVRRPRRPPVRPSFSTSQHLPSLSHRHLSRLRRLTMHCGRSRSSRPQ